MQINKRDRRALQVGAIAVALWLILRFAVLPVWDRWQQARTDLPLQETALIKYRQALAAAGAEKTTAETLEKRLREVESELLASATPALASAELQDWVRQTAANHAIEVRSSEFLAVRPQSNGYVQVPLGLQFQCRLDQLVNFLSAMHSGPKILAVPRLAIQSSGGVEKLLSVNMTIAGVAHAATTPASAAP